MGPVHHRWGGPVVSALFLVTLVTAGALGRNKKEGLPVFQAEVDVQGGMAHGLDVATTPAPQIGEEAAWRIARNKSNTVCELPCVLQNGCVCAHNCSQGLYMGEHYSKCISCAPGYSGDHCQYYINICWNNGVMIDGANGQPNRCQCPYSYTGSKCEHMLCMNSEGGTGPSQVMPREPYPGDGQCHKCEGGWHGLNCGVCSRDSDCQFMYGNETNATCNTTLAPFGTEKMVECELTDDTLILLMSDFRAGCTGFAQFNFSKPSGFDNVTEDGVGAMTFWRLEPKAVYLDPFFYCSFAQCSAYLTNKKVKPTHSPKARVVAVPPNPTVVQFERRMSWALLGTLTLLILLAFVPRRFSRQKSRVMIFLSVLIILQLGFHLVYFSLNGHSSTMIMEPCPIPSHNNTNGSGSSSSSEGSSDNSTEAPHVWPSNCIPPQHDDHDGLPGNLPHPHIGPRTEFNEEMDDEMKATDTDAVVYTCKNTTCGCAAIPPNVAWQYQCPDSFFDHHFIQKANGVSALTCNQDGSSCIWDNVVFGQGLTANCSTGKCHKPNATNQTGGALTVTHTKVNDHAAEYVLIVVGALAFVLLCHFVYDRVQVVSRAATFESRFVGKDDLEPYVPRASIERDETEDVVQEASNGANDKTDDIEDPLLATPVGAKDENEESATLVMDRLTYRVAGKTILNGVSGHIRSGSTIALMGPSGAGKTTLLDLLSMRTTEGTIGGTVSLNNEVISSGNTSAYKHLIGYVAQTETLIPALTVRQTIRFAARLKLPAPISNDAIEELVDDTLDRLHLRRCEHTQVGDSNRRGVSGGEKRRVSIATELVGNPRILVLDEPTSGLDSVSAFEVVRAITGAAKKTQMRRYRQFFRFRPVVIFSIHQPSESIWQMFDQVCLLQDGYMMYFGAARTALADMRRSIMAKNLVASKISVVADEDMNKENDPRNSDPGCLGTSPVQDIRSSFARAEDVAHSPVSFSNQAEALLMLTHKISIGDDATTGLEDMSEAALVQAHSSYEMFLQANQAVFEEARTVKQMEKVTVFYRPSVWQQFSILSKRTFAALIGSYYLIASHALFTVFLGVTLAYLYESEELDLSGTENKAGLITFVLLLIGFSSLSSLELFIAERGLFEVEHANGYYGTLPYFTVKLLFDFIPLRIIPTAVFASIIYFPVGMRLDGGEYYLWFVEIITVYSMASTSFCFIIAIIAPAFGPAALFASLLLLWNTAFGGLLLQPSSVPAGMDFFRSISPVFYAYEALMVNELKGLHVTVSPISANGQKQGVTYDLAGETFLYNMGLNPMNFARDVSALLLEVVVLIVLAFAVLKLRALMPRVKSICRR